VFWTRIAPGKSGYTPARRTTPALVWSNDGAFHFAPPDDTAAGQAPFAGGPEDPIPDTPETPGQLIPTPSVPTPGSRSSTNLPEPVISPFLGTPTIAPLTTETSNAVMQSTGLGATPSVSDAEETILQSTAATPHASATFFSRPIHSSVTSGTVSNAPTTSGQSISPQSTSRSESEVGSTSDNVELQTSTAFSSSLTLAAPIFASKSVSSTFHGSTSFSPTSRARSASSTRTSSSPSTSTRQPLTSLSISTSEATTGASSSTTAAHAALPSWVTPSPAANLSQRDPTFYLGIALGSLAGVALLFAMAAWIFRIRNRAKHRAAARINQLPWGRRPSTMSDVEALAPGGSGSGQMTQTHTQPIRVWSPSVGVGYVPNLDGHTIPSGAGLLADDTVRSLANPDYLTASVKPHRTFRHLPSHMVDQDLLRAGRSPDLGGRYHARGSIPRSLISGKDGKCDSVVPTSPLFGTLRGDGMAFASGSGHESSRGPDSDVGGPSGTQSRMVDRLRNGNRRGSVVIDAGSESGVGKGEQGTSADDPEGWTSIRFSLVSAFNAVTSTVSGPASQPQDGAQIPAVGDSRSSSPKPWVLEEREDGTGVVHLQIADEPGEHLDEGRTRDNPFLGENEPGSPPSSRRLEEAYMSRKLSGERRRALSSSMGFDQLKRDLLSPTDEVVIKPVVSRMHSEESVYSEVQDPEAKRVGEELRDRVRRTSISQRKLC